MPYFFRWRLYEFVDQIGLILSSRWRAKKGMVVVVDGIPASGKSTIIQLIVNFLKTKHIPVIALEGDYFLVSRGTRDSQIALIQQSSNPCQIPKTLHQGFWDIKKIKKAISQIRRAAKKKIPTEVILTELYNRETGRQDKTLVLQVEHGSIVLLAGCYLMKHINANLNILLNVSTEQACKRKREREFKKPTPPTPERIEKVIKDFLEIEEPSLSDYLLNYGQMAQIVADTTFEDFVRVIRFPDFVPSDLPASEPLLAP